MSKLHNIMQSMDFIFPIIKHTATYETKSLKKEY